MTFQISAQSSAAIRDVTLFFRAPGDARTGVGKPTFVVELDHGSTITATYFLDLAARPLPPFAAIEYWWEIQDSAGSTLTTDKQIIFYEDNRFDWRTLAQNRVTVHWYEGDTAFGQAALDIAANALVQADRDLHVLLPERTNVYIYANAADVQEALRRAGRAWAGGHADPALGVVIVRVSPGLEGELNLGRTIPHELTHLLIYQATGENYARVPSWLNEGLAVLNQAQPDPDFPAALSAAREGGTLLSLSRLCAPFPADVAQAQLAYAESESIVRYIRDQHGSKSFANLLRAYADGASCEAGVERGLGISLDELEQAWLREVINTSPGTFRLPALTPWLLLAGLVLLSGGLFTLLMAFQPARLKGGR
ncbi:MAG: peptidase MA family metallohydrolase [Anaerolineales bacterium]